MISYHLVILIEYLFFVNLFFYIEIVTTAEEKLYEITLGRKICASVCEFETVFYILESDSTFAIYFSPEFMTIFFIYFNIRKMSC